MFLYYKFKIANCLEQVYNSATIQLAVLRSIVIYARISWEITKNSLNLFVYFLRRFASVQRSNYNYRPVNKNPLSSFTSIFPQSPSTSKRNFDEKTVFSTETEVNTLDDNHDDYVTMETSLKSPNNIPVYSSVKKNNDGGLREETMPLVV